MVSVIDASKSDEDNVVKENFSCFVVQLVYYKISSNIWVFSRLKVRCLKYALKCWQFFIIIFSVYPSSFIKKVVIIVLTFKLR